MTVNYDAYLAAKKEFLARHDNDFTVFTSTMDEYDSYHKEYVCADGAIWYEVLGPAWETIKTEVRFVPVEVAVKLFRVEFYSSDNAVSNYYYEKY